MQTIDWQQLESQPRAKCELQSLLEQGALQRAMLLHGPEGVGKWTHASSFACKLLQIPSAQLGQHPDVRYLQPEGAAFLHSMQQIQDMIEDLTVSPHAGLVKCYFVLHAECMLPVHANALLKALEELPPYAVVFLLTHHIEQILPTIASRCYKIAFAPLTETVLTHILHGQHLVAMDEAARLTMVAEGSVTQALAFHSETGRTLRTLWVQALKAAFVGDGITSMQTCEAIEAQIKSLEDSVWQKRHMNALFSAFAYWFRDIAILQRGGEEKHLFYKEERSTLNACLHVLSTNIADIESYIERAKAAYAVHTKPRHILEYLLFAVIISHLNGN